MNTENGLLTPHELVNSSASEPQNLVEKAMGAAMYLIAKHAETLAFYQLVETDTLERWMVESFPEVVTKLRESGEYEVFSRQLDVYREKLASAATSAGIVLEFGCDNPLESDYPGHHRIFSGLLARVATGQFPTLDEAQLLTALLVDKHAAQVVQPCDHSSSQAVVHQREVAIEAGDWGPCDMRNAKIADNSVAHLIPRQHFPAFADAHSSEDFVLVIRLPSDVPFELLIQQHPLDSMDITSDTNALGYERTLVLGGCPILMPMRANEDTLNLFRNKLPVLYAHDAGCVLVEYPWNSVADFSRYMHPIDDTTYLSDQSPEESAHKSEDFLAQHPHTIRVSEVRPMPVLEGPHMSQRQREELSWALDEIPF